MRKSEKAEKSGLVTTEGEKINDLLKVHTLTVDDWRHAEIVRLLHGWAERFNREFKLNIDTPAIRIEQLRKRTLGTYRSGRNGLGILHEIAFNIDHLDRPQAHLLDTLLHELLHEWQEIHGNPGSGNYHNAEIRKKARELGLLFDHRGRSEGIIKDSPFVEILERHRVDTSVFFLPMEKSPWLPTKQGKSKLKKYSCSCTNVRAAVELHARCLVCGDLFFPALSRW